MSIFLRFLFCSLFAFVLLGCYTSKTSIWHDGLRNRDVSITVYKPAKSVALKTSPVILGVCYGCETTEYTFLANRLKDLGYVVAVVRHELPTDPPLAREGDLYTLRMPSWEQGVRNVSFVAERLKRQFPLLDSQKLILIGHSHGGDVSMLFTQKHPERVAVAITLDHRRVPIPRISQPRILSIRADEFVADAGVIPTPNEQRQNGIRIVQLVNAKHGDLTDIGSESLKQQMATEILDFIQKGN